jgi:hypothetical protein
VLIYLRKTIEQHRNSKSLFWKALIKTKDALYQLLFLDQLVSATWLKRYRYIRHGIWYSYSSIKTKIEKLAKGKCVSKIDLMDTTFIIPIRYDSDDRVYNVEYVIKYLRTFFDTNILIGEEDSNMHFKNLQQDKGYNFFHSDKEYFHRTKVLNDLTKLAKTSYIVNYDADVLVSPLDMYHAIQLLRNNKADMVLPYNGRVLYVSKQKAQKLTYEEALLDDSIGKIPSKIYAGGVVCSVRSALIDAGMENEGYIAWGWEDEERYARYKKLGYRIARTWSPLIHLEHHRDVNGKKGTAYEQANKKRYEDFIKMTKEDLVEQIKTWPWARL